MRYDEVLIEKASKFSVDEVKLDLHRNYARIQVMQAATEKVDDMY
jgi:hypothetical protein